MSPKKIDEQQGDWLFITPISNLVLTNHIGSEIRIERVTFVDKNKLPRIRKRLGLSHTIGEFNKHSRGIYSDFFSSSNTFAVIRQKGIVKDLEIECYRLIKNAIYILLVSQLGYSKRRLSPRVTIQREYKTPHIQRVFLNTKNITSIYGGKKTGGFGNLLLSGHWKEFQKDAFFFKLLKVINNEVKVKKTWRSDLKQTAILIGRSLNTDDYIASFLWNMIALERLLTREGDKYSDALPERIEAILGWVGFWSTRGYETRIKDIYKKRCNLVHCIFRRKNPLIPKNSRPLRRVNKTGEMIIHYVDDMALSERSFLCDSPCSSMR